MFSFIPAIFSPTTSNKQVEGEAENTSSQHRTPEQCLADYIMERDKKSFDLLYKLCADDLYHYLITLSDITLAKDIAQQTWVKVMEKPHGYHTAGSVKGWLFTISRNTLIDEFRKSNRLVELDLENQDQWQLNDEQINTLSKAQFEDAFDQALLALPFAQREAFCLQQEGFSLAEIANMTASKQETIKTRLRYARNNLQQLLESIDE